MIRFCPPLLRALVATALVGGAAVSGPAQNILPAPVQPDPFAPLPPGTIIGPGGPTLPGLPPSPSHSVVIPPLDAEAIWMKMVDVTDDYFKVQSEQRVVFANGVPTEGRIDTYPQTGATLLEPWRRDSVGFRERLESTLQSIRRSATLRLIPDPAGWRIEVMVNKELENLPRPMHTTTGAASFRNDDSLYRYGSPLPTLGQQIGDAPRPVASPTTNIGWIPLGRDPLLEQKILEKLITRLGVTPLSQPQPYYEPPTGVVGVPPSPAPPPSGPVFGAPILPEQLPPGAVVAPGPPVPIETLPVPR
jgi:hypothetical protein